MNTSTTNGAAVRCRQCGSSEIQVCLPAYFAANGTLERPESVDCEADALSYWCPECDTTVEALSPDGEVLCGLWD